MSDNIEGSNPSKTEREIEDVEIKLQYHLYLPFFAFIYYGSYLIPGIICMLYILLFFKPYFLDQPNFISLFTELNSILAFLSFPIVIFASYILHLFFIGLITRLLWRFTERMSPSKSGIILRTVPSDTLNYYHIRSFIIKYGKNVFTKGMFPWLANWFFNFVGSNKIGKGTTIEEQIVGDKFIEVGDNCYIGVNSPICSHVVEGIFGRIVYFKVNVGDNVTCGAFNIIGPGSDIKDNSYLLPLGSLGKHQVTKGNNYYFGLPARKIFRRKIMEFLKLTQEDLDRDKELSIKQQQMKNLKLKKVGA